MNQEVLNKTISFEYLSSFVSSLNFEQKRQLREILDQEIKGIEVEGSNEIITQEELTLSDNAWDDYISGRDSGISSQDLKRKLLGDNCV